MMRTGRFALTLLAGCSFATGAAAADYDYELGLAYGWGQFDGTFATIVNGVPTPSLGISTTSSDSDTIDLSGAWYYSGRSDADGPKSRAAFLSRASSIVVGYSRGDESGSASFTGGGNIPPVSNTFDSTSNEISVDLRHVWVDSGWYALAGVAHAELEGDSVINGAASSSEWDATAYALGVGRYLGKATTLDLSVLTLDAGGSNPTVIALTFNHVGSISETWQYGASAAYAKSDTGGDGDVFAVQGALYPSVATEFGLGFTRQESARGSDQDAIEAFAGWFVRDHVELTARYRMIDADSGPGEDTDSDEFGVGVSVRF